MYKYIIDQERIMRLPECVLHSTANLSCRYTGIDSIEKCLDKEWFKQFPHDVNYNYNSRGFRDDEWPSSLENLRDSIWCIGDSFTVGLGSPFKHTWPQLLQKQTNIRTINVSLNGASNNWISRKAASILQEIQPKYIIIHWSYLHRGESDNCKLSDEERLIAYKYIDQSSGIENFRNNVDLIKKTNNSGCRVIHSFIPDGLGLDYYRQVWKNLSGPNWPVDLPKNLYSVPELVIDELTTVFKIWNEFEEYYNYVEKFNSILNDEIFLGVVPRLDRARDGHHYDILTSQFFVDKIISSLK